MCASLGCGSLNAKCTQYPWLFCVSLGMTLDSPETPFAKTPFSSFLTNCSTSRKEGSGLSCPRKKRLSDKSILWSRHRVQENHCCIGEIQKDVDLNSKQRIGVNNWGFEKVKSERTADDFRRESWA